MMHPHINIYYANVERLACYFEAKQAAARQMHHRLVAQVEGLKQGKWQSDAATRFYREIEAPLAGLERLSSAMGSAASTLRDIACLFEEAEEAGANAIPVPPGGVATSAKATGIARKARNDVQQEPTPVRPPEPDSSQTPAATPTPDAISPALTPEMQGNLAPNNYSTPPAEPMTPEETPTEEPASVPFQEYQPGSMLANAFPIAAGIALSDGPEPFVMDVAGGLFLAGVAIIEAIALAGAVLNQSSQNPLSDNAPDETGSTDTTGEQPDAAVAPVPFQPGQTFTTPNGETWSVPNTAKKAGQFGRRGWTEEDISDVIDDPADTNEIAPNRPNPENGATAYYREDGHYVVRDNQTDEVIAVSDRTDPEWKDDTDPVNNPDHVIRPRPREVEPDVSDPSTIP